MFAAIGLRLGLLIGGAGLIALLIFGGYKYVTNLQTQLENKIKEVAIIENALKTSTEAFKIKEKEVKENLEALRELDLKLKEAYKESDSLRKLLAKHDLTKLAIEKPGLIEKRINDATDKTFDDIERLTSP